MSDPRRSARSASDMRVMLRPSRNTSPAVGASRPATSESNVDLPLPDGPATATNCPFEISRSIPRRIVSCSAPDTTVFETCSRRITQLSYAISHPGGKSGRQPIEGRGDQVIVRRIHGAQVENEPIALNAGNDRNRLRTEKLLQIIRAERGVRDGSEAGGKCGPGCAPAADCRDTINGRGREVLRAKRIAQRSRARSN